MNTSRPSPRASKIRFGRDEMNLAELPFASLLNRSDSRDAITYEGWQTDKYGNRYLQRWVVEGGSVSGLPTEFDERVYIALLGITSSTNLRSKKVAFSVYQILNILGLATGRDDYLRVESALARLVRVTFQSEQAFFDKESDSRITTTKAFHLIDEYWLRYKESDSEVSENEGVPAYIIWSDRIWRSIQAGYIKNLDLHFFRSLSTPLARRLYRFLDKRMQYQTEYEIDIFELASRLAMVRYKYPSRVRGKMQPALDELIAKGFLVSAETKKVGKYTRMHFVRHASTEIEPQQALPGLSEAEAAPPQAVSTPVVAQLVEMGLDEDRALALADSFDEEHIQGKIELLEWKLDPHTRQKGRPIEDPAGWLIRAIEQDYQPPAGFCTKAERESARRERAELMQQAELAQQSAQQERAQSRQSQWEHLRTQYGTTQADQDLWVRVQARLKRDIPSEATYQLWIAPVELLSYSEGQCVLGVPNRMVGEWIMSRARKIITAAFEAEVGEDIHLQHVSLDATTEDTTDPEGV